MSARTNIRTLASNGGNQGTYNRVRSQRSRLGSRWTSTIPSDSEQQGAETLAMHLLRAQEEERLRIAVELHDGINQEVAMLSMELGVALSKTGEKELKERLSAIRNRAIRISEEIRRISHRLRPALLEYVGFVAAVRSHCRDMSDNAGFRVDFSADETMEVPMDIATDLYRIMQESMQNVVRHACASVVTVNLAERNGIITMLVEDNGVGLRREAVKHGRGMGLASMRERARSLGGELSVMDVLPHGTRVHAMVPIRGRRNENKNLAG